MKSENKLRDLQAQEDKVLARVKDLAARYELEVDQDTQTILKHIVKDGIRFRNLGNVLTRDWAIDHQYRMMDSYDSENVRQKAFEFLCQLLGYAQDGKRPVAVLADVVIGELNDSRVIDAESSVS